MHGGRSWKQLHPFNDMPHDDNDVRGEATQFAVDVTNKNEVVCLCCPAQTPLATG